MRLLRSIDPPPVDEVLEWLEHMKGQAGRAKEIIHRFRGFVSGGQLRRTLLDLNVMISECLEALRPEAARGGIELTAGLSEKPCNVSADRVLLEQALRNLTSNALEAVGSAAGDRRRIRVTTERDGPMVEVRVEDRGPGVPPELRDRIFDPFFSTKAGGVGIGLAIARAIVDAHGGQLSLSPTPGGGATFGFRLPLIHGAGGDNRHAG
jgi:signal transduction histidine kinase